MFLLFGKRLAEILRTNRKRVLVRARMGDFGQAVLQGLGRVKIRETLRQVDCTASVRDARHVTNDRFRKMFSTIA